MRDLREASGVSLPTIQAIEAGGDFRDSTADRLVAAFEAHGVEITNGDGTGARLRSLNRGEVHEAFEALVAALNRGDETPANAQHVLQQIEGSARISQDQLPRDLAEAVADLTQGERAGSYGEAAKHVRALLDNEAENSGDHER